MAEPRYVEIRGTEFVNKGAELMMHAILAQLPPGWTPVIEASSRNTRAQLRGAGVRTKRTGMWSRGDVADEAISVVLDASGFAYSDFWGPGRARRRLGRHLARWKTQGKRLVLLPQAFGPFEGAALRTVMTQVLGAADLVFPRDPTSMEHLAGLGGTPATGIAPDFTNLLEAPAPDDPGRWDRAVVVVPNRRMIQVGKRGYASSLVRTMEQVRAAGYEPVLLVQETGRDPALARRLSCRLDPAVPVVLETDAIRIKSIIGASAAVITSRYHSLVCALSQGVPCLATSWSHKYRHLVDEYGYGKALVASPDVLPDAVSRLLEADSMSADRAHLLHAAEPVRDRARAMWATVFETIDRSLPAPGPERR